MLRILQIDLLDTYHPDQQAATSLGNLWWLPPTRRPALRLLTVRPHLLMYFFCKKKGKPSEVQSCCSSQFVTQRQLTILSPHWREYWRCSRFYKTTPEKAACLDHRILWSRSRTWFPTTSPDAACEACCRAVYRWCSSSFISRFLFSRYAVSVSTKVSSRISHYI